MADLELIKHRPDQRAALGWTHAERALSDRTELVPELEAQHERALSELADAQRAVDRAEATWEAATQSDQRAGAALAAVEAHLERARAGKKTRTGMSEAQLEDFASTKRKGLPQRVKKKKK